MLYGAGDGTRTRECELGKLVPYHLATPARPVIVAQFPLKRHIVVALREPYERKRKLTPKRRQQDEVGLLDV